MDTAIPTLMPRVLFGLRLDVKGTAQFLSDEFIVYPVGSVVTVHNMNEKKQRYIRLQEKGKNLTQIVISPNKKWICTVELATGGKSPNVTLWEPSVQKKKRSFYFPDVEAICLVDVTFSFDSKLLFCVTGEPEWQLFVYKVETGKLLSTGKALGQAGTGLVKKVFCNPNDLNMCVVIGDSLFRILTYETQWKQFGWGKADQLNFTTACWLTQDRILAGTDTGRVYVFEHGELKNIFLPTEDQAIDLKALEEAAGSQTSLVIPQFDSVIEGANYEIREMINFPKGIVYGFTNGRVYLYEKESPTKFKRRNIFQVPDQAVIRDQEERKSTNLIQCLSINPAQDRLLIVTEQMQIYTVKLWLNEASGQEIMAQEYGPLIHDGPIGGLSVCRWKTIVLTSGLLDRTLKIWNYETQELELMQRYEDDVSAVALHPTGLYAVAGFTDKLRYFNIMIDDFMLAKEFPIRNCKLVTFSKLGHIFAAANSTIIQIYSTIFFNLLYAFKGHNGRITSMSWSLEDRILGSCGTEGACYEWDVSTGQRVNEYFIKSCPFTGVAMASHGRSLFAVGEDGNIKEMSASNLSRDVTLIKNGQLNCVVLSQIDQMLFVSGGGTIFSIKLPILDKAESLDYVMHSETVRHMAITFDDRYLLTGSDDGSLCFWKIICGEGKQVKMDGDFEPSKEILISKSLLEERINKIKELELRLKELETEHAYQMRQSDAIHNLKLKEIHASYCGAIEDLKEKNDKMEFNHTKVLNKIHEEIAAMEIKHDEFIKKLEASYNEKLIIEYDKYVQLEDRLKKVRMNYIKELEDLQAAKEKSEHDITIEFLEQLKDKQILYEELQEQFNTKQKEHEVIKQQIEDDADAEIYEMRAKQTAELREEHDQNLRLRGELTQSKKKLLASQKEIEDIKHILSGVEGELKRFKNQVMLLERNIADLKKEIQERDQTIEEKEKRIFQLKGQNQELEKFKFILDFKIKELKSQIEPRERTIMEQAEQINEMVHELEKLQRVIMNLDLSINDLKEKLMATTNECIREVAKNRKMTEAIKQMRVDIHNCSGYTQNIPMLIKTVKDMYHKYNADVDFTISQAEDFDVKNEFMRQREFLERTSSKLQKQAIKNTNMLSSDKVRLVGENVQLLHEANDLRKNLKQELKINKKMKSLLGLTKYMLPSQAQKKMDMATATREEIHNQYKDQLAQNEFSMNVLKEEKDRLLNKLTSEDTGVTVEEKPIPVFRDI